MRVSTHKVGELPLTEGAPFASPIDSNFLMQQCPAHSKSEFSRGLLEVATGAPQELPEVLAGRVQV